MTDGAHIPVFTLGTELRQAEGRWWLAVAGERSQPNAIAVDLLRLVNGHRPVDTIVDLLALRYEAPRQRIMADVVVLLDDLVARGAILLREQPQWKLSLAMLWTWLKLPFRRR